MSPRTAKPVKQPHTPELDKMSALRPKAQVIGEFLDWLRDERGYSITEFREDDDDDEGGRYWPVTAGIEKLLAEFLGLDLNKIEKERQAILDALRKSQ